MSISCPYPYYLYNILSIYTHAIHIIYIYTYTILYASYEVVHINQRMFFSQPVAPRIAEGAHEASDEEVSCRGVGSSPDIIS